MSGPTWRTAEAADFARRLEDLRAEVASELQKTAEEARKAVEAVIRALEEHQRMEADNGDG